MATFDILEHRNHKWLAPGILDMEINHPTYGWIPYTAKESDPETALLYTAAASLLGPYKESETPARPTSEQVLEAKRKSAVIGKPELFFALHNKLNLISEQEAKDAVTIGKIPAAFAQAIEGLPPDVRLLAELKIGGDAEISRMNPLLVTMAESLYGAQGKTILDALFNIT